jgi:hypothetical protein
MRGGLDRSEHGPSPGVGRQAGWDHISLRQNSEVIWGTEPVVCGDGVVGGSEQCDAAGESASCDIDCTNRVCGDGVLNPTGGEVCDPGISSNCNGNCSGYPTGQGCTNASKCLEAKLREGDLVATDGTVRPQFTLVNNSAQTITLSQIKLRYWFTRENNRAAVSGLLYQCDLATVSCPNVTATFVNVNPTRTGADTYLEVGFSGAATLRPGESTEVRLRFNWNNWANFTETNDYSYLATTTYTDTTKVTVYRSGQEIWGLEP